MGTSKKPPKPPRSVVKETPRDEFEHDIIDPEVEKPVRKNHYLYQSKIDMAKEILDAKSETEAIDGALDLLIYGEAMARGTEAMRGEEYNDILGIAAEIPSRKRRDN